MILKMSIKKNKSSSLIRKNQDEILNNSDFFNELLNNSLFEEKKIFISQADDKV